MPRRWNLVANELAHHVSYPLIGSFIPLSHVAVSPSGE